MQTDSGMKLQVSTRSYRLYGFSSHDKVAATADRALAFVQNPLKAVGPNPCFIPAVVTQCCVKERAEYTDKGFAASYLRILYGPL